MLSISPWHIWQSYLLPIANDVTADYSFIYGAVELYFLYSLHYLHLPQQLKQKPYYNDLDPKAVTNDELFGVINPATREWKDGLFSVIMRDMANMAGDGPKWIVLDGDIDPMWIESLNTLMDDNKVRL